jgi:hypothetical protein
MNSFLARLAAGSLLMVVLAPVVWVAREARGAEESLPASGAPVQVREGDSWSSATFVRKEGRRLLIKYPDGSEEWVTADRMRTPSGSGTAGARSKDAAPASPAQGTKWGEAPPESSGSSDQTAGDADSAAPSAITPVPLEALPIEIRVDKAPVVRRVNKMVPATQPASRPSSGFIKMTSTTPAAFPWVKAFVPCLDTPNVVLVIAEQPFKDDTYVLRVDLNTPDQYECRTVNLRKHDVLGAADGGRVLLTTAHVGQSTIMHIWEYDGIDYQPRGNYSLTSNRVAQHIFWAAMVNATRVVVGGDGDNCYLVDLKARRALSSQNVSGQNRGLNSTGQFMTFVPTPGTVRVMRVSDLAPVAEFADGSPYHNVSIDPTGTFIAFVTMRNTLRVVRMANGAKVGEFAGAITGNEQIDLLSGEVVLVDHRMAYEVKRGIPMWEYATPPGASFRAMPNGQMLCVFAGGTSSPLALVSLPEAKGLAALKAVSADKFKLAPGAAIRLTGNLGFYGKDQAQAIEAIGRAVTAAGHHLAKDAKEYELNVSCVAGPEKMISFRNGKQVRAPCSIVTLSLNRNGEVLWEQIFRSQAQVMVLVQGNQTLEQAVAEEGKPKLLHLNFLAIPGYIPKGSTPKHQAALGASTVTPDGFGPPPERKEEPGKPAPQPGERPQPKQDGTHGV